MSIFSPDKLNNMIDDTRESLNEGYGDKIKQNANDVKGVANRALDNARNNIRGKKKNLTKFTFDENGDLIEEKSSDVLSDLKNTTAVELKKAKIKNDQQNKYDEDHPIEFIVRKTGSAAGAAVGGAVGGVSGAVGGAAIGAAVGGTSGAILGSMDGSNTANKAIGSLAKKTREAIKKPFVSKHVKHEDTSWRSIYRSSEYNDAINEYFDISDTETRRVLLAVTEEDQSKVLVSLTSKLYDSLMDKFDDIDFGEIPLTKGDITKLSNFENMRSCISIMSELLDEFKQDKEPVNTISLAIQNMMDSVNIWKRAYAGNIELPMVVYNTIVLSIIEATSYLLSMCIEFIKLPSQDTFQAVIDKSALSKSKNHMIFENIRKFNTAYENGQIENAMEFVIKENVKNFGGITTIGVGASIVGIVGLLFCIIPIIRELIFLFYFTRVRVSEFFDVQSDLLQMSAYNVKNNRLDLTKEERNNISSKQMKVAERFRSVANRVSYTMKDSEIKASKGMKYDSKKYKVDEVLDELPDSASSSLF